MQAAEVVVRNTVQTCLCTLNALLIEACSIRTVEVLTMDIRADAGLVALHKAIAHSGTWQDSAILLITASYIQVTRRRGYNGRKVMGKGRIGQAAGIKRVAASHRRVDMRRGRVASLLAVPVGGMRLGWCIVAKAVMGEPGRLHRELPRVCQVARHLEVRSRGYTEKGKGLGVGVYFGGAGETRQRTRERQEKGRNYSSARGQSMYGGLSQRGYRLLPLSVRTIEA